MCKIVTAVDHVMFNDASAVSNVPQTKCNTSKAAMHMTDADGSGTVVQREFNAEISLLGSRKRKIIN